MLKKSLTSSLLALTCALSLSAQEALTLAEWDFQSGFAETIDGTDYTYTPQDGGGTTFGHYWFNSATPTVLPKTCVGDAKDFVLSAYSEGRYWQFCTGYGVQVFRIENTVENPTTDYTNPENHKAYYQLSFPTKGYKDIAINYSIAPGNNTETPVEFVVSTDGGQTWIDAGHTTTTSSLWFQYVNRTVNLSVNNKDQVIVRLLPTAETTNWNMNELSISGMEMEKPASVDNKEVTFTWNMGSLTPTLTGTPSDAAVFSVYEMAIGTGLTASRTTGITGDGAGDQTLFKPSVNNAGSMSEADAIVWTVTPKKGVTFKPTSFAFQASKHGTGGGKLGLEVRQGENVIMEARQLGDYARNNNGDGINFTSFNESISGVSSSEPVTVILYVYSLATNKEVGLANLVLSGVADGEVEAVPAYTLALKSAVEGAGALSCAPAGAEFDEGTTLTVAASENFGYHFSGWTDENGNTISTANPYKFEIMANTVLVANYEKNNVYALRVGREGGANVNQVLFTPEGNVVDGIHYYEEGTDVQLTTVDNRILSFTNWEDNSTDPVRTVKVNSDMDLTANFSAADYIVGWDFYFDQPASERAADYNDESDNAGLLSLHNPSGATTSWLTRGVNNGDENGKWGARIWKLRSDENYFEVSFRSEGYSNLTLSVSLGCSYNTYNKFNVEYSIDGENYAQFATYDVIRGWSSYETALPEDASNQKIVKIRFMPDKESGLNDGSATDYDGLCISELYILADKDSANDSEAPVLVAAIPANGSDGASATGSIILTFNEKVVLGNGNATLNGETIAGKVSGKSVIYSYAGLDYATEYTFSVPAGAITDRSGNAYEGASLSFTTLERAQPEARLFDAIVAADGSGNYTSVQEAIDAAPTDRVFPWLIFVKNGNYKEHVNIPANKPYMHIIGQDRDKTVILDDQLCGGDNAVHVSVGATVVVNSNDCFFENITLENSYGHEQQAGPQALALNTIGDRAIFNNVAMLSYQDTWITTSTSSYRAYVRNSFIEGAVDFIYNSGDLYVENTTLYINRKSGGFIVAPSHGADVKWGYVFNNCTITAPGVPSETNVWLGRPWHNSPKTVFLNTKAEVTIPAAGWYETMGGLPALWADWNTVDGNGNPVDLSQRRDTYYKTGDNGERVYGKAKNYLTDEEAAEYTVKNVLSGSDNWQPVIKTESCATPVVTLADGYLTWDAVPYAICYLITRGDDVIDIVKENSYALPAINALAEVEEAPYTVQAINEFGGLSQKGEANDIQTGIDNISSANTPVAIEYYDIQGIRHSSPVTGVNIVRNIYADGSVNITKIVVK